MGVQINTEYIYFLDTMVIRFEAAGICVDFGYCLVI